MMSIVLSLKVEKGKPVLRGQEHFWSVIMKFDSADLPFTVQDIDGASNTHISTINEFVKRLKNAGLIECVGENEVVSKVQYRPTVKQSSAPRVRRDGSIIESQPATRCMWNLIRGPVGRTGFTFHDLVRWASTDETTISPSAAKTYVKMLSAAGYLIELGKSKPGQPTIWRLDPKMNFGPQAPMILRTKMVFDPNRSEVFGPAEGEEIAP